jgi:hypothetical protein
MRRIETYELIERYLLGRASPGEKTEIELRMKNDPSFAEEVERHRGMQQVIQDQSVLDVRDMLTRIRKEKQISIKRRNRFYRSMLIVGSCAIIVSLSLLFILNNDDSAVRRASEASQASEAFTGTDPAAALDLKSGAVVDASTDLKSGETMADVTDDDVIDDNVVDNVIVDADDNASATPDLKSVVAVAEPDLKSGAIMDEGKKAAETEESEAASVTDKKNIKIAEASSPPCEIKAEYTTEASCNNKATGVIKIMGNTLTGGTPPYRVFLNEAYDDSMIFRGLKPGFYKLEIRDAAGCLASFGSIFVGTKECRYQGNFYPLMEQWEIPLDFQPGTIEIYNKNGQKVYELRFDGMGKEYWNGNDLNNEALPMGLYLFTIRYDSGDMFEGSVTINR